MTNVIMQSMGRVLRARDLFAGVEGWGLIPAREWGWTVDGWERGQAARMTRDAAGFGTAGSDVRTVHGADGGYEVDIASPPCQTFGISGSGSGRRDLAKILQAVHLYRLGHNQAAKELLATARDPRTSLVLEPLRVALEGHTRCLAWEQVPPVLPIWKACAEVLRDHGYHVATGIVSAEQYGVPQTRRRAILVARLDNEPVFIPAPTHSAFHVRDPLRLDEGVLPWVSMADAIGWGMKARPSYTVAGGGIETGGAEPLANTSRKAMLREVLAGRWKDRPGGPWSRPSAMLRPTVREAGLLQGFPGDYPFQGNKGQQYLQAGNAVPPPLGAAILAQFRV